MDLQTFQVAPEDAQFLESRKFQVTEIARSFNLPPHKIKDLERATFANIEAQNLDYLLDSLQPWLRRIEQSLMIQLFMPGEEREYLIEFLVASIGPR